MKWFILLSLLIAIPLHAETTKVILNPFTGNFDYITKLDSTTLPSGSTQYIQNTLSPGTTSQRFSVQGSTITHDLTLPYLVAGQCFTTNSAGLVINTACGALPLPGGATNYIQDATPSDTYQTATANISSMSLSGGTAGASTVMLKLLPNGTSTGTGAKILFGERVATNLMGQIESVDTGNANQGIQLVFYNSRNAAALSQAMTLTAALASSTRPMGTINGTVPVAYWDVQTISNPSNDSTPVIRAFNVGTKALGNLYQGLSNSNVVFRVDNNGNITASTMTLTGFSVGPTATSVTGVDGFSSSFGITAGSGVFTSGVLVSSGAINPTLGPFTVASNNNYVTFNNSAGSAASTAFILNSSVTTSQANIGVAQVLIDQNINLPAGVVSISAGAFNAIGAVAKSDQGTYGAIARNSNASGGSIFGVYGGQVSIDMVTGINSFAVRNGTGTTRELDAITAGVQQSSGGTVATADGLYIRQQTGIAGGVVTTGGGILVDTQTPTVGILTNPHAFISNGLADILAIAGHPVTFGPTPTISACGTVPNGSVVGTDSGGTITVGGGVVTACTLTFAKTWGVSPNCVYSDNNTAISVAQNAISATAFTVNTSATLGGGLITYRCGCDNQTGCK